MMGRPLTGKFGGHEPEAVADLPEPALDRAVSRYDRWCRVAAEVEGAVLVYLPQHEVDGMSRPDRVRWRRRRSPRG
jgi:hypothetical protein